MLRFKIVHLQQQRQAQLKSGFKGTISWNKYLSNHNYWHKTTFALAFENDAQRTSNNRYYIPNLEIKDCNVIIDGKNFFDQPVKNDKVTYENIGKISTGQGDDCTTGCLLDHTYFKKYYKIIAVDLSKQQALDVDPNAIQQINLAANLDRKNNTRFYFILEEAKETVFDFSQGT